MAMESPESVMELDAVRGESTTFPRWQVPRRSEPTADDSNAAPGPQWIDEGLRFHRRAKKLTKGEFSTTTSWLVDMIKICTEAHRAGAQDLLWMSWLPKKSHRVRFPTRYSGLIALTSDGGQEAHAAL